MPILDALLDSWDRNNTILTNLVGAIPDEALGLRPMDGSPSIGELFTHIHYVRLVFVEEDAPEFAQPMPGGGLPSPSNHTHAETGRIATR